MARTALTVQDISQSAGLPVIAFTAGDATNDHQAVNPNPGNIYLLVNNAGASPCLVTIPSAADSHGRTGDITSASVTAGEIGVFGPFRPQLWNQTGGLLHVDIDQDSSVSLAVVRGVSLP